MFKVDPASLPPTSDARKMTLKRGQALINHRWKFSWLMMVINMKDDQAEFHDAYILHHSDENRSKKRRCAFIARSYMSEKIFLLPGLYATFKSLDIEIIPLVNISKLILGRGLTLVIFFLISKLQIYCIVPLPYHSNVQFGFWWNVFTGICLIMWRSSQGAGEKCSQRIIPLLTSTKACMVNMVRSELIDNIIAVPFIWINILFRTVYKLEKEVPS